MRTEQTFFQKTKRFLFPIKDMKKLCLQHAFKGFLIGLNPFVHVFFIQGLVRFLETGNQDTFGKYFILYLIYIILYEIVEGFTFYWGWYRVEPSIKEKISKKYMSHFVVIDNNEIEKIGTGKTISTIEKGIDTWSLNLSMLIWFGGSLSITFVVVNVYLISISFIGCLIFLLALICTLYFSLYLNTKMKFFRKKRIEQVHLYTGHIVKMIMTKMEILQSNNLEKENNKSKEFLEKNKYYNVKMSPYFHTFF